MYRLAICFLFLLFTLQCQAQESKLLLSQELIQNWEELPIYPRLVEGYDDNERWKPQFKYIDSIDIYRITYLSDGLKVNGLLVKPKEPGSYPCIIYNRGGNREFGKLVAAHGILMLGKLAKEGYVVIASQYRGNGGSEGQEEFGGAEVNDILILPEVLKEVPEADTEKIGMYGWSRGGMMTYLALTKMDQIKAAVVGGARSDLTLIDRPNMETGVYAELIPNYYENKEVELKKRSAVYWADQFPKEVPILLLHGNADWRVKSTNSLKLALEFEAHRIPYRLKIFEGADHGINEFKDEVHEDVLGWFDKYLKAGAVLPNMEYHGR